jgi:hypothetical protein
MPLAERFDPLKSILERRWINGKRYADPVFHSKDTPYVGEKTSQTNTMNYINNKLWILN